MNPYIVSGRYNNLPKNECLALREVLDWVYDSSKSIAVKMDAKHRREALDYRIASRK